MQHQASERPGAQDRVREEGVSLKAASDLDGSFGILESLPSQAAGILWPDLEPVAGVHAVARGYGGYAA